MTPAFCFLFLCDFVGDDPSLVSEAGSYSVTGNCKCKIYSWVPNPGPNGVSCYIGQVEAKEHSRVFKRTGASVLQSVTCY
jgi:hypothetical protein